MQYVSPIQEVLSRRYGHSHNKLFDAVRQGTEDVADLEQDRVLSYMLLACKNRKPAKQLESTYGGSTAMDALCRSRLMHLDWQFQKCASPLEPYVYSHSECTAEYLRMHAYLALRSELADTLVREILDSSLEHLYGSAVRYTVRISSEESFELRERGKAVESLPIFEVSGFLLGAYELARDDEVDFWIKRAAEWYPDNEMLKYHSWLCLKKLGRLNAVPDNEVVDMFQYMPNYIRSKSNIRVLTWGQMLRTAPRCLKPSAQLAIAIEDHVRSVSGQ